MTQQTSPPDFFSAGGTLPHDSLSYVKRAADQELLKQVQAGSFCYVLTARQMGKSSLMIRTLVKLRAQGVKTAIIDMTRIGLHNIMVDQWYLGVLYQLQDHLNFSEDPTTWWEVHSQLSPAHRFTNFLRDVILTEIAQPIVIFIDEIDLTLHFEFRDDFFAAIRSMYNSRAQEGKNEFNRLTFVLLGVTTPTDLIKNPVHTPFNIGNPIFLSDFSKEDAQVLQEQLEAVFPNQGQVIFDHIYHWTNGHPYLTQKLCLGVVQEANRRWSNEQVINEWIKELFQKSGSEKDDNIKWVENFILNVSDEQRAQLLALYKKVYQKGTIPDDGQSIIHNQLKLSGLVKEKNGKLHPRNRIYQLLFDLEWVAQKNEGLGEKEKPRTPIFVGALLATLVVLLISSQASKAEIGDLVALTLWGPTQTPLISSSIVPASATSEPPDVTATKSSTPPVTPSQIATSTPTPSQPATSTVTPSQTATSSATPSVMLEPTNRPYSSPVLVVPKANASISEPTLLEWSWNSTLQVDEYFDVRVWRKGEPANGIAWTKDRSYQFDPRSKGSGNYFWNIVVIRGRDSTILFELSQIATPRPLSINREEGTSTDKPTPVLLP